jgi:hypothetical protein
MHDVVWRRDQRRLPRERKLDIRSRKAVDSNDEPRFCNTDTGARPPSGIFGTAVTGGVLSSSTTRNQQLASLIRVILILVHLASWWPLLGISVVAFDLYIMTAAKRSPDRPHGRRPRCETASDDATR